MFWEIKRIFEDTIHSENCNIYHDVWPLFVAADAYQYMQEKEYYMHLIVPQNGLSKGTIYAKRMAGMCPEPSKLPVAEETEWWIAKGMDFLKLVQIRYGYWCFIWNYLN